MKIKYKIIIIAALFLILAAIVLSRRHIYPADELEYGVTFSKKQAEDIGLDWKKTYNDILYDLGAKKIRLPAYWDEIENSKGEYFWDDMDYQLIKADEADAEVILAVGGRLPRWPECHFPDWAPYDKQDREDRILKYIQATIDRYKNNTSIKAWQVENEPFLPHFGNCPNIDTAFLDKEITLVRSLDSSRPIVVTDSGELSLWVSAAKRADIFGITMYRDTYSSLLKSYVHYPIGPGFFRFKRNIVSLFAHPAKWIVIELQAEPWGPKPYTELSESDANRTMNLKKFQDMIKFSSQTGFSEFYLWGAEWWYWKAQNGQPEILDEAKLLFNR